VARRPDQQADAAPAATAYATAAAAYDDARAEHRRLIAAREGAQAALQLLLNPLAERERPLATLLHERAEAHLAGRDLKERHLRREIEDLEDWIAAHTTVLATARQEFEAARDMEAAAIARQLQPAHRAAVNRLAQALEAVSQAIEAERAVRAELTTTGLAPTGCPVILPDCTAELSLGTFAEYSSRLSEWRRRMVYFQVLG
jgi:hypothetical protein